MKRAVARLKVAGLTEVIPYPEDFITRPSKPTIEFSLSAGPNLLPIALHEHIGYLAYWLSGQVQVAIRLLCIIHYFLLDRDQLMLLRILSR